MSSKVVKRKGIKASPLEEAISKAFVEIEANSTDIKAELEPLHFVAAKELNTPGGKKAIVLFVPSRLLSNFRKVQVRLIRELEKKFSGKHVIIIAQRKIVHKEHKVNKIKRVKTPRNKTLTAVNDAILEDVAFPTEIVAKRLRVRLDNSRLLKVYLDKKDQANVEAKLDTFAHVYHQLTKRNVQFLFPATQEIKNYSFTKKQQLKPVKATNFGKAIKRVTKAVKTGRFVSRAKKIELRKGVAKKAALKKIEELRKIKQAKKVENIKKALALRKAAEKKKAEKKAAEEALLAAQKAKTAKPAKGAKPAKSAKVAAPVKGAKSATSAKVEKNC